MSYIGDMRKFVGHAPIMAVAAMAIKEMKTSLQCYLCRVIRILIQMFSYYAVQLVLLVADMVRFRVLCRWLRRPDSPP